MSNMGRWLLDHIRFDKVCGESEPFFFFFEICYLAGPNLLPGNNFFVGGDLTES